MSNKLMIVESPKKCKIIKGFLKQIDPDSNWDVEASFGHIQDLNKDKDGKFGSLGINKESLDLDYKLSKKGVDVVKTLKSQIKAKSYSRVVIATDPDREGEAIAAHLRDRLQLGSDYDRCTFNEITLTAVEKGLKNPRKVDEDLIKAQDTRRILDRVTGWEATSAVSRAINQKTPIGRVVNQAVKLVVEREEERRAFVEQEYYGVQAIVDAWSANLDIKKSGLLKEDEEYWKDKDKAKSIADATKGGELKVIESKKDERQSFAPYAFKTSTMQKAAINKLKFKGKKTDEVAQQLYQNGHITYIRTDSTVLSEEGFEALRDYALKMGLPVLEKSREGKKGKVDQEAHECIRPTDFNYDGADLPADEKALYNLIKDRCIASQLKPALYDTVSLILENEDGYIFRASGATLTNKGWKEYFEKDDADPDEDSSDSEDSSNPVPLLNEGDVVTVTDTKLQSKKTKIPPRLTQATLIDILDKKGIGRPSTYSSIYEKIGMKHHGYVSENKFFLEPSQHAEKMVNITRDELCIMDTAFTTNMEDHLDEIANGKIKGDDYVYDFFKTLEENLDKILKKYSTPDAECLACGQNTLRKIPRKNGAGYFWACQNEECKKTYSDQDGKAVDFEEQFYNKDGTPKFACPKCERALYKIKAKSGKAFWWICSDKRSKDIKCNYITANGDDDKPDFEYQKRREEWMEKVASFYNADGTPKYPCPSCGKALIKNVAKSGSEYFKCSSKKTDCDYFTMADDNGDPQPKKDKK